MITDPTDKIQLIPPGAPIQLRDVLYFRAASAAVISPDKTDNTIRIFCSTGNCGGRDIRLSYVLTGLNKPLCQKV
ncbi:hypothetical protein ABIE67_009697 [Streptomyces sp. V4I8]